MISIVLVSHSRKIAEGVLDLLRQVAPGVQIAEAAGVGPDYAGLGTDAVHIAEVIQAVFSADGVLVLMDLGSAVLSAEMALELLPDEMRELIRFCPGAFVEGALAAAVQAGLGGDLLSACRESQNALAAKIAQLSPSPANQPAGPDAASRTAPAAEIILKVMLPHGLHLRPAARFVQEAGRYQAEIQVWNLTAGSGPAQARSINALAMLAVRRGDEIRLAATGPDAEAALRALGELARRNFGEEAPGGAEMAALSPAEITAPAASSGAVNLRDSADLRDAENLRSAAALSGPVELRGVPISPGTALAPLYRLKKERIGIAGRPAESPQAEWDHFEQALERVKANIQKRQAALEQRVGPAAGSSVSAGAAGSASVGILTAHRLFLEDPQLIEQVRRAIFQEKAGAAAAWAKAVSQLQERYRGLADPYLRQRAADIADVGEQVLAELAGKPARLEIHSPGPVILYAEELAPNDILQLNPALVAGLLTAGGGTAGHSAILARALGIPAVSGIRLAGEPAEGTLLALDGETGQVWIDPPAEVRARCEARRQAWEAQRKAAQAASMQPARLKSGRRIAVMANIGSAEEAGLAAAQGADGVGLLRSEFLFLSRAEPPGEEEQFAALRKIAQALDGRPVIVRTLDAGGDKDLPYLGAAGEANPFLGVRAIRLALRHPGLFQAQLRAILRAAEGYPLRVMFPMIATLADLTQALEQLEAAHAALSAGSVPHRWPIETGIMVETPSAALLSEALAPRVDFFSIGTNDLTQYTLAADRGSPALAAYHDALHPAVLRLIDLVARSARRHGKWCGICGELAADPQAAPVLAGLGLAEFSLNPAAIPRIKETLRGLEEEKAAALAERVLQMESAERVREEAVQFLK